MATPNGVEILCTAVEPTKVMGPPDGSAGPLCKAFVSKTGDRQCMRIEVEKGWSWTQCAKPHVPGNPDWCPVNHFGYLSKGQMKITMKTGESYTVKAGESYVVAPGHLPEFSEDTVMHEFSQDQTMAAMVKKD